MVGMRAPVFIVAGTSGLTYRQFILWDALGMAITAPTLLALGYYVGPPVLTWAEAVLPWLRNIIGVALVIGGATLWWQRRQARQS